MSVTYAGDTCYPTMVTCWVTWMQHESLLDDLRLENVQFEI